MSQVGTKEIRMLPNDNDAIIILIVTGIVMLFFSTYIGVWNMNVLSLFEVWVVDNLL